MLKDYFRIERRESHADKEVFHISINSDCDIFRGHFPGKAVLPGACNINMVKECAQLVANEKLTISEIKTCRMKKLMTPSENGCPQVHIRIRFDENEGQYEVKSEIVDNETTCMTMNAVMMEEISDE